MKKEEIDYRVKFCLKYFGKTGWKVETLNRVDVLLHTKTGRPLLYIESKERISSDGEERRKAVAQALLTNKKQEKILGKVAILYYDTKCKRDMLELIDCEDSTIMFAPEVKWDAEKPSNPSDDAVFHLNNRVADKITSYKGEEEILSFWREFKKSKQTSIKITYKNCRLVYSQWKKEVHFSKQGINEQELVNLFLADVLNNAKYTKRDGMFNLQLIREGTNINCYTVQPNGIGYNSKNKSDWYVFADTKAHDEFWRRYYRPPVEEEFLKIMEHSNELYSDKFRRSTGGEYTPSAFVRLQNKLIARHYNMDDFIVFDPCAGVGNLEIDFGRDYRDNCYLSTLLEGDVDQCKFKNFSNAIKYDYLKTWFTDPRLQPKFLYKGEKKDVCEIAEMEGKKLMIVMNPPFIKPSEGFKYDRCIEFFRKVILLQPDVIVYYCKTEFFFRQETCKVFVDSGYKIREHVISNAKTTFKLSAWPISLVIFDRDQGRDIIFGHTHVQRYEEENGIMEYNGDYEYDNERPNLVKAYQENLESNAHGLLLGQWTIDHYCIMISNRTDSNRYITTKNLWDSLVLKGINFNTHPKYYETQNHIYRGQVDDITTELRNDAIIYALFYKGNAFSNKEGRPNYLMPFPANEMGCGTNDLYVLFPKSEYSIPFPDGTTEDRRFDFREWMKDFQKSEEAQSVYDAALAIVRYYHNHPAYADGRDWNDSFYDIKNTIMNKDATAYQHLNAANDHRVTRVKTQKGAKGFSKVNVRKVTSCEYWPMFDRYFDAMKLLAEKIVKQLVNTNLLLWEPSNLY
jgi:hypothetical protein